MRSVPKFILLYTLAFTSCGTSDSTKEDAVKEVHTLSHTTTTKPIIARHNTMAADTLTVTSSAAVFYQPDSVQMKKRMTEVGEEDFRIGMDDYLYYMNGSWTWLEGQGLPCVDARYKKYIRFIAAGKKTRLIRLDTLPELWGVYLFHPAKAPYKADLTNIEKEYQSYFS